MPSEKVTISNVTQFVGLAKNTPGLLNLGGLFVFRPWLTVTGTDGCQKCSQKKAQLAALRPEFEAALLSLTASEQARMKTLLDTSNVCYWYKKANGQLAQQCF